MIAELFTTMLLMSDGFRVSTPLYYTPEGYEIQRFDCTPTACTGVDGSHIGHPDNVKAILPPIRIEDVNTRYHCDDFCYDQFGFIIGVVP